jgi:hypothetical protein
VRETVRRHLGKVVAGTGIAVAGTALMVGITLPGTAGADDSAGGPGAARTAERAAQGRTPGGPEGQAAVEPGVVAEAPPEGERGIGRDPLTDDEVDAADAPRRADVTFYDYRDDTLVTRTVNLDTGKVERTLTQRGVQPPLSRAEDVEAAEILLADPLSAGLKADYKDATGRELTSPDQLALTSMVYGSVPGAQPAALDACGEHRCARLFPKVVNGPWIDARHLVIDLSARKVAVLDR